MKTVLTFSGGIDSTYVLWKLLSETQDEITAIFISSDNLSPADFSRYDLRAFRGSSQATADASAQWLQSNVRSFTYVVQTFDSQYAPRGFGNVNSPQTYLTRFAVPRINSGEFDRLICTSEKENDGASNGGTIDVRRPGSMAARDIFAQSATRGSIEFPLIAANYTQANALTEMPSDLLDIVDHCTLEDNSYKCKKKRWFQNLLDQGKTPAQCYDAWYTSCTNASAGKWFSMKFWIENTQPTDQLTWAIPEWPTSYSA
jgi:hypothetical protein